MHKPTFDPGLTEKFTAPVRRIINKDGSFNVHRLGVTWRDAHPYLQLINMPWSRFLATVLAAYLVVNTLFASVYFAVGSVQGADATTDLGRFANDFFFSAQTLSTVGYGAMSPKGLLANCISAFEAMVGLMGFALATGLLFGRVSRPSAKIRFSESMILAPYQEGWSLQFRVVNKRANSLMELEATLMLMTVEGQGTSSNRTYKVLKLERSSIYFFPLTWTIVHPLDTESPLHGKTAQELKALQAELLILIKGWDDTFSQTVHARHSYRYDEIKWGARFAPAFHVDESGDLVVEVDRVGDHAGVNAPLTLA